MRRRKRNARRRAMALATAGLAVTLYTLLLFAYTPEQDDVNGAPVATRWPGNNLTWEINPTVGSNIFTTNNGPASGPEVTQMLQASFNTWTNTPLGGQVLNALTVTGPTTSTLTDPNAADCLNVISLTPSSAVDFSTGTIAFTDVVTSFGNPPNNTYTCTVGNNTTTQSCPLRSCLIDTDIAFNRSMNFSTQSPIPQGCGTQANPCFDLQSVATHEIGHMLGLDHSGITHVVMFPFGDTGASEQRNLAVDDAAGLAFLYPSAAFSNSTGSIAGTVTLNNVGAFAAHIVVINATTGNVVVDGLTNDDGTYNIQGILPGNYNVMVLPLAPDVNSGLFILSDFGGWSCGYGENSAPCCQPGFGNCSGTLSNPTNYTGKFF